MRLSVMLLAAWMAFGVTGTAQEPMPSRTPDSVRALPMFWALPGNGAASEVTIRWVSTPLGADQVLSDRADPRGMRFDVARRSVANDPPSRERSPEIGADEIVVVAVDTAGREIAWLRLKDPRIIRSEQPGPDGQLSGVVLYRNTAELVVRVPDGAAISTLRLYEPQSTGAVVELRAIGTIGLP